MDHIREEVMSLLGERTAYVERTHLTSRQMNGRLVRKTLSYSKKVEMLKAASAWEDWILDSGVFVRSDGFSCPKGSRAAQAATTNLHI